jgi:hypothetical protein
MHHRTSGGSSETDAKELTVIPMGGRSALSAVMTATPVGKHPKASRKARTSNSIAATDLSPGNLGEVLNKRKPNAFRATNRLADTRDS